MIALLLVKPTMGVYVHSPVRLQEAVSQLDRGEHFGKVMHPPVAGSQVLSKHGSVG